MPVAALTMVALLALGESLPQKEAPTPLADLLGQLSGAGTSSDQLDQVLPRLREARAAAQNDADRKLFDRAIGLVGKLRGADPATGWRLATTELLQLARDGADLHPTDERLQAGVIYSILAAAGGATPDSTDAETLRAEAERRSASFVAQSPKSARAHLTRASVQSQLGTGGDGYLRSLFQCAQLDGAGELQCRDRYNKAAKSWAAPECRGDLVPPGLEFRAEVAGGGKGIKVDGEEMRVAPQPLVTRRDVVAIARSQSTLRLSTGDRMVEDCNIELSETAALRFAQATEQLSRDRDEQYQPKRVVVLIGEQPLFAPRVQERIANGRIRATGVACNKICPAPRPRPLPKGLPASLD